MSHTPAVPFAVLTGPPLAARAVECVTNATTNAPTRYAVQALADAYLAERLTHRTIAADRRRLADELLDARRAAAPAPAFTLDGLEACEPSTLDYSGPVRVTLDGENGRGFAEVSLAGPTRSSIIDYVRAHWGDEDAEWFGEYVCDRIEPIAEPTGDDTSRRCLATVARVAEVLADGEAVEAYALLSAAVALYLATGSEAGR